MNADMTHCRAKRCPFKEDCYRYWLHKNSKARIASYFAAEPYDEKTNECNFFIQND